MAEEPIIAEPKVAAQETPKRTLVAKLCRVMKAAGYLQKRGKNEAQKYNYATEADVAEMMREKLAAENVFIFPNLVRNDRTRIERPGYKPGEVKVSYATDVEYEWTFVDGDTGEREVCRMPGSSETPGDKGVYVATTGSEKYLLMKAFLIPTGDDPESDENEPRGTKEDAQAVADAKLEEYKRKEAEQLAKAKGAGASQPPQIAPKPQERPSTPTSDMAPVSKIEELQKKDKSAPYWKVTWKGVAYSTFDSTIIEHLSKAKIKGEEVRLLTVEKENKQRPGVPFHNLVGISRIHNTFFEDDGITPIIDVNDDLQFDDSPNDAVL